MRLYLESKTEPSAKHRVLKVLKILEDGQSSKKGDRFIDVGLYSVSANFRVRDVYSVSANSRLFLIYCNLYDQCKPVYRQTD